MSTTERETVTQMPAVLDPRVVRGAALLDEKMPGWFARIDLDTFSLWHCDRCIAGQLGYDWATDNMGPWNDHGLYVGWAGDDKGQRAEYNALEQDWRLAILSRRTS